MSDDESNGGSGNGTNGHGHGFDEDEEPTVVLVSRDFLVGSLGRAAAALHGAGDVCLDARALVTSGGGETAIRELIEELEDLASIVSGMARALDRLEFKEG